MMLSLLLYCGLCVHPVYLELLSSICPFLSPQCLTTTSTSPNSALAPWQSKLTSCKRRAPTRPPTTQTGWPPSLSSSSTIRPSLWPSRFVLSGYVWLCSSLSLCCFDQPLAFLRLSACVQFLRQAFWLDGKGYRGHGCQHSQRRTSLWKEAEGTHAKRKSRDSCSVDPKLNKHVVSLAKDQWIPNRNVYTACVKC